MPPCPSAKSSEWNDCFGKAQLPDSGGSYSGEWKNGKPNGQGALISSNGKNKYVGSFINGLFNGAGIMDYESGGKHFGSWKDGKINGEGTHTWIDGRKYVGNWVNGAMSGWGVLTTPDGNTYTGEFKDGQRNGQGSYSNFGNPIEGLWANGQLVKNTSVTTNSPKTDLERITLEEERRILAAEREKLEREKKKLSESIASKQSNQSPSIVIQSEVKVYDNQTIEAGKRIALVIGNSKYDSHPLSNPKNDADDMSKVLRESNFEVIDLRDSTLVQMRSALRLFGDKLNSSDVGLVYYSGHGIEVKGRNYLIPVNADIKRSDEVSDQSLDMGLILEKMETAKKGINILIVDACRDDPFGRSFRSSSRGLAQVDAPKGTIIAFSTSPGRVAADGEGRNSPYTKNLVKAIRQPNLPIEQVFKLVRREVQRETNDLQTPWENTSLSGDFYFKIKK